MEVQVDAKEVQYCGVVGVYAVRICISTLSGPN
jgi:hypothetical protein